MGQITLYLDKQSEAILRQKAQRSNLSISKWVAGVLKTKTRSVWTEDVRRLAGAWPDLPDSKQLRKFGTDDVKREAI